MTAESIGTDLNSVIVNAVNARIEAQVLAALSGDEVLGRYVVAALNQPVEVPEPGNSYRKIRTTFLKSTIDKALQTAVETVVRNVIAEESPALEVAVRKELRKNIATVAAQLVGSVNDAVKSPYGIKLELRFPS